MSSSLQVVAALVLMVNTVSAGYLYGGSGYGPHGYGSYGPQSYGGYYPSSYGGYPSYGGYYGVQQQQHAVPTITVLAERPYTVDKSVASVPLLVIPQSNLNVIQSGHISAISATRPLVTLQAPSSPAAQEAMPAVRVVLRRPMYVTSQQSTIPFPAGFTIVHEGLRMPIPVGAVIAPVPTGTYFTASRPVAIRVVYAVPTGPLPVQYPYYQTLPARPIHSFGGPATAVYKPALPSRPQQTLPQLHQLSTHDNSLIVGGSRPNAPVVTILDFPSSVASPSVLFFQPPANVDDDSELGNRDPPQAAVPAGIVQSTAPQPNLSVFVNSKESPVLQTLREEAEKNKQQSNINKINEALYN